MNENLYSITENYIQMSSRDRNNFQMKLVPVSALSFRFISAFSGYLQCTACLASSILIVNINTPGINKGGGAGCGGTPGPPLQSEPVTVPL